MSSDAHGDRLIATRGVSKTYLTYQRSHHRLFQAIAQRLGSDRAYAREIHALEPLDLDLYRGECLAIIGRNGSGKSTLLQILAGSVVPTTGTVESQGRISAILELGAGFNPEYTGRENFRTNAAILGMTASAIRSVEPAVEEFADIGAFFDEPIRTYSSGMYVRLAFATAIHVAPEILVIDEALAVGDVFFQQKCLEYLQREFADVAKILVTHDLTAVSRIATRCVVLEDGRKTFDGPPLEAIEHYLRVEHTSSPLAPVREGPAPSATASEIAAAELEPVPADKSSNPNRLAVTGLSIAVDGVAAPCVDGVPTAVARSGQRVDLRLGVGCREHLDDLIVGYFVRDRVGNQTFGQNTIGSDIEASPLAPGTYTVNLSFDWPEVAEGEFTLTVGFGNGVHPFHHEIVSWAQNIAAFVSVPERPVHGMFNQDIQAFRVERSGARTEVS